MNHKRRRPKNRRAGCLYCKPHKMNHAKHKDPPREERKLQEPAYVLSEKAMHHVASGCGLPPGHAGPCDG